jgi:hypothetical protein
MEGRSKRSKIQHSFQNVDDNDSGDHYKWAQSHLLSIRSWEQQLAWQSHSPALPIADTASSADVLSSDPNPTAFAAMQIDPKPYFTPFKSRLSSYDGDHQPHVRSGINCRLMGKLITKEIPAHMMVEDQLLCQKIFPLIG